MWLCQSHPIPISCPYLYVMYVFVLLLNTAVEFSDYVTWYYWTVWFNDTFSHKWFEGSSWSSEIDQGKTIDLQLHRNTCHFNLKWKCQWSIIYGINYRYCIIQNKIFSFSYLLKSLGKVPRRVKKWFYYYLIDPWKLVLVFWPYVLFALVTLPNRRH